MIPGIYRKAPLFRSLISSDRIEELVVFVLAAFSDYRISRFITELGLYHRREMG
jgi:hypothetical protein